MNLSNGGASVLLTIPIAKGPSKEQSGQKQKRVGKDNFNIRIDMVVLFTQII